MRGHVFAFLPTALSSPLRPRIIARGYKVKPSFPRVHSHSVRFTNCRNDNASSSEEKRFVPAFHSPSLTKSKVTSVRSLSDRVARKNAPSTTPSNFRPSFRRRIAAVICTRVTAMTRPQNSEYIFQNVILVPVFAAALLRRTRWLNVPADSDSSRDRPNESLEIVALPQLRVSRIHSLKKKNSTSEEKIVARSSLFFDACASALAIKFILKWSTSREPVAGYTKFSYEYATTSMRARETCFAPRLSNKTRAYFVVFFSSFLFARAKTKRDFI